MKRNQLGTMLGLVVVVAIVVSVLIWPNPKECGSVSTFQTYVWWDDPIDNPDMGPLPVIQDDLIWARFDWNGDDDFDDPGEDWQTPISQGFGLYKWSFANWPLGDWQLVLADWDWAPVNPNVRFPIFDPTVNDFDWEVEPD